MNARQREYWNKIRNLLPSNSEKAQIDKIAASQHPPVGVHHILRLAQRAARRARPASKPLKPAPAGRSELVARQKKGRPVYTVGMNYPERK